jgi:hypothetical protein
MKDLKFICAQPCDLYYTWQVHLWLESLRSIGHSDKAIVLIFIPINRESNMVKWEKIMNIYAEAEFVFYHDEHEVDHLIKVYIPIIRPYMLYRYFKDNPEMSNKAIFYCDSDIVFTEKFDVQQFLNDEVCYLSDTNSYINASYFDSKVNDVLPNKLEEYKTRDVLKELVSIIGITREVCVENNLNSGGAQYLLKNIDASFWNKVINDCIIIRKFLQNINREFFESENKGFQSWCADMWAILWNLWLRKQETKCIQEMAFAWAPDPLSKLETHTIYHNAGIAGDMQDNYPCFYKGKYHQGGNPFLDTQIDIVLNHEESKKHCTWYYANKLKELNNKYHINY